MTSAHRHAAGAEALDQRVQSDHGCTQQCGRRSHSLGKIRRATFAPVQGRLLVESAPDRVIWGSDWPHIPEGGKDTGALLDLLSEWAPNAAARERILVANPARLFGFEE